jgi:hypothetical protein
MAKGGEIFVLDMGEPVKIVDLARTLIQLSGLEPDKDIKIVFTGLRPGEKLFEEINLSDEEVSKTSNNKIFVMKQGEHNFIKISRQIDILNRHLSTDNADGAFQIIHDMVPSYLNKCLVNKNQVNEDLDSMNLCVEEKTIVCMDRLKSRPQRRFREQLAKKIQCLIQHRRGETSAGADFMRMEMQRECRSI